jgi:hypothetical protein
MKNKTAKNTTVATLTTPAKTVREKSGIGKTQKPLSWSGRAAYIQTLVVKKLTPAQIVEKTKVKFPQSSKGRVIKMIAHAKKVVAAKA